jgi:acyl-CoA synthetase (AMP-forming)/AMP-acid ligase II
VTGTPLLRIAADNSRRHPDRSAVVELDASGRVAESLTHRELWSEALAFSACLDRGVAVGIAVESRVGFVVAFLAAMIARAAPVALPPLRGSSRALRAHTTALASRLGAALVVADDDGTPRSSRTGLGLGCIKAEGGPTSPTDHPAPRWREIDDLAYLQCTSGTTGDVTTVAVTHDNVVANCLQARVAYAESTDDVGVGWLPLHHDMGLITQVMRPTVSRYTSVMLQPMAFLRRPGSWLTAISAHRGTTTSAPNFAYSYCSRRVPVAERRGLDLSCLRVARVAAEPVLAETLDEFASTFGASGFDSNAFCPSYGLAEATLTVSTRRTGEGPRVVAFDRAALESGLLRERVAPTSGLRCDAGAQRLVSCGRPLPDTRIAVVDTTTLERRLPGVLGEICVAGPQVATVCGAAARTQYVEIPTDGVVRRYVRTGDVGALVGGEVFLVSRTKDVLIVRGRNLVCWALEETAWRAAEEVRDGRVVAFGTVVDGTEAVNLALEVRQPADAHRVVRRVASAVATEHGVAVHTMRLLPPGSLPKTTSGKLQRDRTRQLLSRGELTPWASWSAATGIVPDGDGR